MTHNSVPETGTLIRVVAPHFVAGLVIRMDICVEAAPILRWALQRNATWIRAYFARKGWKASVVTIS